MCDRPNANGRIFPKEEVEKAIAEIQTPPLLGQLGDSGLSISLSEVAYVAENLRFNEYNCLIADIRTIDTPKAKLLEPILDLCEFTTVGTGIVNNNSVISDFKLLYVSANPKQVSPK